MNGDESFGNKASWRSKWGHLQDFESKQSLGTKEEEQMDFDPGPRRNSVSKMFHRIRSGSLPGWIGRSGGVAKNEGELQLQINPNLDKHQKQEFGMKETQVQRSQSPPLTEKLEMDENKFPSKRTLPVIVTEREMPRPVSILLRNHYEDIPHSKRLSKSSSKSSNSSGSGRGRAWTTDTTTSTQCYADADEIGTSPSFSRDQDDDFRDHDMRLLRPILNIPEGGFPPPHSIDSSPSTPRKQFTIIPCQEAPPGSPMDKKASKKRGNENLGLIVSALYGKLLVVMGIAFPLAEVISTYIPPSFYDGFYLYLYFGSITFMISVYGNMLRQKATRSVRCTLQKINTMKSKLKSHHRDRNNDVDVSTTDVPEEASSSEEDHRYDSHYEAYHHSEYSSKQRIHFGSFYLRMGAVAFGIGSMIYSGLEFGQYFELDPDTKCHNFMIALTPAVRMIFTFMQMYFIFLNSKMAVYKLEMFSTAGLMHMIGTNLAVWLNVLVQETRHEILMFYNPDNGTMIYPTSNVSIYGLVGKTHHGHIPDHTTTTPTPMTTMMTLATTFTAISPNITTPTISVYNSTSPSSAATILTTALEMHHRVKRGLKGPYSFLECRRSDIMGSLVQNASPFLFPCTIEYSLICAAILYVMWKSMAKINSRRMHHGHFHNGDLALHASKRSPHHYSVDCARANKGLFLGIFVLVMTIISLILFFVLITRPGYQALAVLEVNITELVLYTMSTAAVLIGMCQMRELRYVQSRNLELDNILLIVAQTGSFIYNVFSIIGGHFIMKRNTALVLITALASLVQLLVQTIFILDASKRSAVNSDQARRKPGREVVTFLLVCNLGMWMINTLEKSRADSHPVQLKFYGVWAWTIITHISMPLAIFYRFHSTVVLVDIWKKAYKIKPSNYH